MFYQEGYQQLQIILRSYTSVTAALFYQAIGGGFLEQQRIEEALYNFEMSRELNPNCETLNELLGECYLKQKRYQAAHTSFDRIEKVDKASFRSME
jgi:tetratricopeptide (TPR) repeat protein